MRIQAHRAMAQPAVNRANPWAQAPPAPADRTAATVDMAVVTVAVVTAVVTKSTATARATAADAIEIATAAIAGIDRNLIWKHLAPGMPGAFSAPLLHLRSAIPAHFEIAGPSSPQR